MKKSAAPKTTPTGDEGKTQFEQMMYQRSLFLNMALNMTWQLAIVVIVPIVGGYKLDGHFKTAPWLTVIGFLAAAAGVVGVLIRIVRQASDLSAKPPEGTS